MILIMIDFSTFLERTVSWVYGFLPKHKNLPTELVENLRIISHRGLSKGQVENTLAAFRAIEKEGVYGIEFDIRWTQDNVPIVLHDPTTKRVFGPENCISVAHSKFSDIRSFHPQIPSLEEVVGEFGGRIHLMIEFKTILTKEQQGVVSHLLNCLEIKKDYHLMAIQKDILKSLLFTNSSGVLAISILNPKEMLNFAVANNLGGLTGHFLLLSKEITRVLHKEGLLWGTGFADNISIFTREIFRSPSFIYSNQAIELARFCKEYTKAPK